MPGLGLLPSWRTAQRPVLLRFRSSRAFIFSSVITSTFTDLFLYGVIVPVVPFALENRVHIAQDQVQKWVSVLVAVYGVALLLGCPLAGYLSDATTTRRWPYLSGLVLLTGATGLLCAGTSLALWIVGRLLQGLAGAVVAVTGTALLVDTVGKKEVGHYLGFLSASQSLGLLMGPLLGGVVYDRGGYYAVFEMCFGLLAVDIVLRVAMVEKQVARKWLSDAEFAQTVTVEADDDTAAKDEEKDVPSPSAVAAAQPLPPPSPAPPAPEDADPPRPANNNSKRQVPPILSLLKSRRLLAALWGSLVQAALFTAFDSTLPLRVQRLFHWNTLGAGLIFLPLTLPTFSGPLVGWANDRFGPRWFAAGGFLLAAPPLACLRFVDADTSRDKVLLCALLALAGLAIAMALPSLASEITYIVDRKEARQPGVFGEQGAYAQAYGLFWMAFAAGCLVGPLWGGFIQQAAGWGAQAWTLALLSGVTALPTALWCGGWVGKEESWTAGRVAAGRRAREARGFA